MAASDYVSEIPENHSCAEGGVHRWEAFFSVRNLFDNARNVIVPGELAPAGDLEDHSAIYIHGGRNLTTGIRVRF